MFVVTRARNPINRIYSTNSVSNIEARGMYSNQCGLSDLYRSILYISGFGGLGVACWPLVPKFAGSNPAEAVGFLGAKKSSARLPSEGK